MTRARREGFLFVYGSLARAMPADLRTSEGSAAFGLLTSRAELVGEGSVQGRLYAVSWYPGYVPGRQMRERVRGEVWRVRDAGDVLPALDAYEGEEYVRVRRRVRMEDGARLDAWVYVHAAERRGAPHIESGDYAGWLKVHGRDIAKAHGKAP